MITKFTYLEFELFTKPSKSDFLRVPQYWMPVARMDHGLPDIFVLNWSLSLIFLLSINC